MSSFDPVAFFGLAKTQTGGQLSLGGAAEKSKLRTLFSVQCTANRYHESAPLIPSGQVTHRFAYTVNDYYTIHVQSMKWV